jgi:UTP--glucose-1-phosphate uridylyltransferase
MNIFEKFEDCVVAVERVPKKEVSHYGIIGGTELEKHLYQVNTLIEKPAEEEAPSNLAIIGKYIITPEVFEILLDPATIYKSGEIRLIDAFSTLLLKKPIYALEFSGVRYDCGNKLGLLKANVEFGLSHPDIGGLFHAFLKSKI